MTAPAGLWACVALCLVLLVGCGGEGDVAPSEGTGAAAGAAGSSGNGSAGAAGQGGGAGQGTISLQLSPVPGPLDEGTEVQFVATAQGSTAGLTFWWDFGDDLEREGGLSTAHFYQQSGGYTVTLRALRGGTEVARADQTLDVRNVAPDIELGPDRDWVPGRRFELGFSILDPGVGDTHSVNVDWGDGNTGTPEVRATSVEAAHGYEADGTYAIAVTVTDSDGAAVTRQLKLKVFDHALIELEGDFPEWVAQGAEVFGAVRATGVNTATVTLAIKQGPAGVVLEPDGRISWKPDAADAGPNQIVVEASDGNVTNTLTLDVRVSAVSVQASQMISAALGGTLEVTNTASPLFGTKLVVPAGALDSDTTLEIGWVKDPPPDADPTVGPVIELLPSGLGFSKPVKLSVVYKDGDLQGRAPTDLTLQNLSYERPGTEGFRGWVELADGRVDVTQRRVEATTLHFSTYRGTLVDRGSHFSWVSGEFEIYYFKDGRLRPNGSYVGIHPPSTYDKDPPAMVLDLAEFLNDAYAKLKAEGYAVEKPGGGRTAVEIRSMSAPMKTGNHCKCPGYATWDGRAFNISLHNTLISEHLSAIAYHELFHVAQFRSFSDSPATQYKGRTDAISNRADWLWEATATASSLRLNGGKYGGGNPRPTYFYTTGIDGTGDGYDAFPLFNLLRARYQSDLINLMWATRSKSGSSQVPEMSSLAESGAHWLHRRTLELSGKSQEELFTEFGIAYQYLRDDVWIDGIETWLGPYDAMAHVNTPTGDERQPDPPTSPSDDPPLTLLKYRDLAFNASVQESSQAVFALAPACTSGAAANCTAVTQALPSGHDLVLRIENAGADWGARAAFYRVPFDATSPAVPGPPELLDIIQTDRELRIPVASIRARPYDQYVVSVAASEQLYAQTVAVRAYFAAADCPMLATTYTDAYAVRNGKIYTWGSSNGVSTLPFAQGEARCIATGAGVNSSPGYWSSALQVITEDDELWLYDLDSTAFVGPLMTDVRTLSANVFVKNDGSVWRHGLWTRVFDEQRSLYGICPYTVTSADSYDIVTPEPIPGLSNIVDVSASYDTLIARSRTGRVYFYGQNDDGIAGDGSLFGSGFRQIYPAVTQTSLPGSAVSSRLGNGMFAVLGDPSGQTSFWMWGYVNGNSPTCPTPQTQVHCPPMPTASCSASWITDQATCNSYGLNCDCLPNAVIGCCVDGSWSCGQADCFNAPPSNGYYGTEGTAPYTHSGLPTPIRIAQLDGALKVFDQHAVMSDGSVKAFSHNFAGERGDGTTTGGCGISDVKNLPAAMSVRDILSAGTTLFYLQGAASAEIWASGTTKYKNGRPAGATPVRIATLP